MGYLWMPLLALLLSLGLDRPAGAQSLYCGTTGFDLSLGVTTKSWRCRPELVVRGVGTLTLNGTSTITSSGAFSVLATPDSVPGGDNASFKTTGLMLVLAGKTYFLRVSAKASDSSITALLAEANPALSGSVTEWSYWNTLCRRSADASNSMQTDSVIYTDPNLWSSPDNVRNASVNAAQGTCFGFCYSQGAGGTGSGDFMARPRGLRIALGDQPRSYQSGGCPATAQTIRLGSTTASNRGLELQADIASTVASAWPVVCLYAMRFF